MWNISPSTHLFLPSILTQPTPVIANHWCYEAPLGILHKSPPYNLCSSCLCRHIHRLCYSVLTHMTHRNLRAPPPPADAAAVLGLTHYRHIIIQSLYLGCSFLQANRGYVPLRNFGGGLTAFYWLIQYHFHRNGHRGCRIWHLLISVCLITYCAQGISPQ